MKISVSLPDGDVAFLDRLAAETGESRSGALQRAVRALRYQSLADQYAEAFAEGSPWDAPVPEASEEGRAAG